VRLAFILLLLFFVFSNIASAGGKLIYAKGQVQVLSKGSKSKMFQKIKKGAELKIGDIVRTRKNSLAILSLEGGSKLKLNPDSAVTIKSTQKNNEEVFLNKLNKKAKPKFRLKTKTVSMGVRGTSFFASYGKKQSKKIRKDVWMCVNEGLVEVVNVKSKQKVQVKAGEGIKVERGNKISDPKPLAWTQKLNWNMDESKGDLENKVSIEDAYTDPLDEDYD
jgi:hypothetical protein